MSTAKAIGSSTIQLPDATENYSLPTLVQDLTTIADEVNKTVNGAGYPAGNMVKIASGSVTIPFSTSLASVTQVVSLPAGFTLAPNVTCTMSSNVAGRASLIVIAAYSILTNQFTIKLYTSDNAAIGTTYNITIQWIAVGT